MQLGFSAIRIDETGTLSENANLVLEMGLVVDIEKITHQQILKLRKLMPQKEYRKLKNRKSARELRKKKKGQLATMQDEIEELRRRNKELTQKTQVLERKLEKAELVERMRSKGIYVPPLHPMPHPI